MATRTKRPKTILKLKVNGPHIKSGRIPIPELVDICQQAQIAINRQAEVLRGKRGLRPGPTATIVRNECTLELFEVGHGSAALSFAAPEVKPGPQGELDLEIQRLGEAAIRQVVESLQSTEKKKTLKMDVGVRRTFQEMGKVLSNGVSKIQWIAPAVPGRHPRISAALDSRALARINEPRAATSSDRITIDGRLEMADFRLGDLKCILHIATGQRIECDFAEEREDDVYEALRHVVRVAGVAKINKRAGRIERITLETVQVLDPHFGAPEDFFAGATLGQLTKQQGVDPSFDLRTLEGGWPEGEDVDEFLAAIERIHG